MHTSPAAFAASPIRSKVLLAFLVLSDMTSNTKTIRVLYSNPTPKHVVTNKFPVQRFVFPPCTESHLRRSLCFTFVMTTSDGERVYGHTLHLSTGEAMVCISPHPWCGFFQQVMHLYRVNGVDEGQRMIRTLLDASADAAHPAASNADRLGRLPASVKSMPCVGDPFSPFVDAAPASLLHTFSVEKLFEVIAALLAERRVIVLGPSYGSVSNLMLSLLAILAPFEWHHTLITVLPAEMALVLAAPTPYFIGLVECQQALLESIPIEGVVIVRVEFENNSQSSRHSPGDPSAPGSGCKLVCTGVYYHEEASQQLPWTGLTEGKIRWQLQLLKRSPQMKRTSMSFEMDAAEQYRSRCCETAKGLNNSPHEMMCHIFSSYYAAWMGPLVAEYMLKNYPSSATESVIGTVPPRPALKEAESMFFDALAQTQSYHELIFRLSDALMSSIIPAGVEAQSEPVEGHKVNSSRVAAHMSSTWTTTSWLVNPFLVSMVKQSRGIFVKHHQALSHPAAVIDDAPQLMCSTLPAQDSSSSISSVTSVRTQNRRSGVNPALHVSDSIRVGSLLLRSTACCRPVVEPDDDLNDLTPVSGSSA